MEYNVQKDKITYKIDDTVLLTDQSPEFQKAFNESLDENNIAVFDNAMLILTAYGRVLINLTGE